jgi:nucleoside 2-deoxyribosyltransferase
MIMKTPNQLALYLAGAINGMSDADCKTWRELVKLNWAGQILDPMRRDYRHAHITKEVSAEIVNFDIADINEADALLVYYTKPSVGTSMEIFYASSVLHKPVFLVNASGRNLSPWLLHHTTGISQTLTIQTLADIQNHLMAKQS